LCPSGGVPERSKGAEVVTLLAISPTEVRILPPPPLLPREAYSSNAVVGAFCEVRGRFVPIASFL
jgi:hypothetical protein